MAHRSASRPARFGWTEGALLLVVSLVWGSAFVFIREGLVQGAPPLEFASVRYALSAVAFALLASARSEPFPSRRAAATSALIGGTLIIGLYGGLLYWGEQYTTGGYAAVLASASPILTVAFGFPLLVAERLGRRGLVGMAVGFVGVAVLVLPDLSGSPLGGWPGPLFIVAAVASTALGTVLLRRFGQGRQGLWQIGIQFAVAALLLAFGGAVLPNAAGIPLTSAVLGSLAFLVALSSVVGYFAYFALHHRVGPVRANLVAYLAPLVGVGVGTGFLGEPVTLWEVVGVTTVLAGVTLVLRESRAPRREEGDSSASARSAS